MHHPMLPASCRARPHAAVRLQGRAEKQTTSIVKKTHLVVPPYAGWSPERLASVHTPKHAHIHTSSSSIRVRMSLYTTLLMLCFICFKASASSFSITLATRSQTMLAPCKVGGGSDSEITDSVRDTKLAGHGRKRLRHQAIQREHARRHTQTRTDIPRQIRQIYRG